MRIVRLGLLLGIFTLVVTACGGGADDVTETTSTVTPALGATSTSPSTSLPPTTSTSTTTATTTTAKLGATSTIIVVQQDLTVLGFFSGTIDGIAGEETKAAIAKFQADAGLDADGEFGSKTDAALIPKLQSNADYVTELQEVLVELKYYGGPVDGDYGDGTQKGVRLLQRSCELEETGTLDIRTRLCLGEHI
jgi:peptidoglycan hydrolase-like protein with peptidoglycan-binding domain